MTDTRRAETPRPETPRAETPRPETPRAETPRPATPRPETPRADTLRAARAAYARRDWAAARAHYQAAEKPLSADDLFTDGDAAWWLGQIEESSTANEAAYQLFLSQRQPRAAARAAITVGVNHLLRGDHSLGSGWLARGQRLLANDTGCAEHWLLRYLLEVEIPLEDLASLTEPGAEAVLRAARAIGDAGRRLAHAGLVACGLAGEGRAMIKQGRVQEGLPLLDEALVTVLADDVPPDLAGDVYCHLMEAAHELADLRRSRDWTRATTRWLETLPAAALFTGVCRIHRSYVHQATGDWDRAERDARRVGADLIGIQPVTAGEAWYQAGEICRLRGDWAGAAEAYHRAHELGRDPQPGVALRLLAQGQPGAAAGSIQAALAATTGGLARVRLCVAQVEIALAAEDLAAARKASDELAETAAGHASPGLTLLATHARGAVLLAEGKPAEALPVLRDACRQWGEVDAPYECARVRVLLARGYAAVGDPAAAERERAAAVAVFDRLGALPDVRTLTRPAGPGRSGAGAAGAPGGLTGRELEVLALVAAGRSNRQIASALVVSEKTVARHMSNIFTKIGVSSRTEAASYAHTHRLVPSASGGGVGGVGRAVSGRRPSPGAPS